MELRPMFAIVSDRTSYLDMLSATIELKHNCKAIHVESVPVHEGIGGHTVWSGNVEIFALIGHPAARRCFAWVENPEHMHFEFVTVLQKGLVTTPELAVRAWLASKPVTFHVASH